MNNELKSAVEVVASMAGGYVVGVSTLEGTWRLDRVTVVVKYDSKREAAKALESAKAIRSALWAAGCVASKKIKCAAGPSHMGVPLHYVLTFDVMYAA